MSRALAFLVIGLFTLVAPSAGATSVAVADFSLPPLHDVAVPSTPLAYTTRLLDAEAQATEMVHAILDDDRFVLRFGRAESAARFSTVAIDAFHSVKVSFVVRVPRTRWSDAAFLEVRARRGDRDDAEFQVLRRFSARDLDDAKPGRGLFFEVSLPADWPSVALEVAGFAAAKRGPAAIDLIALRLDGHYAITGPALFERPPYLQRVGGESALLRFRTLHPAPARLRYWPYDDATDQRSLETSEATTEHRFLIDGLEPRTRYGYTIEVDGEPLASGPDYHWTTAPAAGDREHPLHLWVTGDTGECSVRMQGCRDAQAVARAAMDAMVSQGVGGPDLWLLLGDLAYPHGAEFQYTEALFSAYEEWTRRAPLWTTPGNHDFFASDSSTESGPYYDAFDPPTQGEQGGVASGHEAFYSFDFGPLHLVSLDSHDSDRRSDGAMLQWLESDLEAAKDATWRIAFFHHPPYTRGSHDSDDPEDAEGRMAEMREQVVPILERHGVDLVLSGHSHGYERSTWLSGHYGTGRTFDSRVHGLNAGDGDPEGDGRYQKSAGAGRPGTLYAVVGSSSEASPKMKRHPAMVRSLATLGSLWLTVDGESLDGRFVDAEGQIRDHFRIEKVPQGFTELLQPGPGNGHRSQLVLIFGVALAVLGLVVWSKRRRSRSAQ